MMMMMILITTNRGWEKLMIRKSINLINLFQSLYQYSVFISSVDSKYCLPPSKAIWIVASTAAAAAKFLLTAVSAFRPIITGMPARNTGKLMMVFSIPSNAPLHFLSRVKVKTEIRNLSVCTHFAQRKSNNVSLNRKTLDNNDFNQVGVQRF